MTDPIRFCFGAHLHQPVGNFGYVFEQHVREVYSPFLKAIHERDFFPIALHVSGPLLEWLEQNDARFLDFLGELTTSGKVELLAAGFYEPILASLPRADRIEQILWMRDALKRRLGVDARGLWLTERVWEPDLAADLVDAGIQFALVDDRHFLVSGFTREQLHAPFFTEHDGRKLALFPIEERLRYLIPFQPPEDTAAHLRSLREQGRRLAVLADDGEKFGGWPGTQEWVYTKGWLDRFLNVMAGCIERGEVALSTFSDALRSVPSGGLAYLPTASYREMEGWSLPTDAGLRLAALEKELGAHRMATETGALVRGSHWRNFLVKYPESNRMHKKMFALSTLCRARGNPAASRQAIGRAQCNDAYWHGVFGGLYLPFLRAAIWENLAQAERLLRAGEALVCEEVDIDGDGHVELWVHSDAFSAIVSPSRGGALEELTLFAEGVNLANALTRRREAYHVTAAAEADRDSVDKGSAGRAEEQTGAATDTTQSRNTSGTKASDSDSPAASPSIHDLEHQLRLDELPPVDLDDRAIFVERVLHGATDRDAYERASYQPVASAARLATTHRVHSLGDRLEIAMHVADGSLKKTLTFHADGTVRASFSWNASSFEESDWFCTELSLDRDRDVVASDAGVVWTHPIETVAKSERGLDRTLQGVAYLVRWPVTAGRGEVELPARSATSPAKSEGVARLDSESSA